MKTGALFLLFYALSFQNIAQNNSEVQWSWTNTYSNSYDSKATHTVVDDDHNIYVAGRYRDTLVMDSITLLGPQNNDAIFIAKFNSLGTVLWARRLDWGNFLNSMHLDSDGDLWLLCNSGLVVIYSTIDGTAQNYFDIPNSFTDVTGNGHGYVQEMKLDSSDNLYVATNVLDNSINTDSCKITKFTTSVNEISSTVWSKSFWIGDINFPFYYLTLDIDDDENVFIAGSTYGGFLIEQSGDSILSTPVSGTPSELFIIKYDVIGNANLMYKNYTSLMTVNDISVNSTDSSLYVTGSIADTVIIYNDTLTVDTTNQVEVYLSKFDLNGNYNWSQSYPAATKSLKTYPGASWGAFGSDVFIADSGFVYLKGAFTGSMIFGVDTLYEDTSAVLPNMIADDVFIAKLDSMGSPIWGKYAGNASGSTYDAGAFWINSELNILYMVGYFIGANNLNKNATPTDPIQGIFIGQEGEAPISTVSIEGLVKKDLSLVVAPNPSNGSFTIIKPKNAPDLEYKIISTNGKLISQGALTSYIETVEIENGGSGIYFLVTEFGTVKLVKN